MNAEQVATRELVKIDNHDRTCDQGSDGSCCGSLSPVMAEDIREEGAGRTKREAEHQDRDQALRVEESDQHGSDTDDAHHDLGHLHDVRVRSVLFDDSLVDVVRENGARAEKVGVGAGHRRGDDAAEEKAADDRRHDDRGAAYKDR